MNSLKSPLSVAGMALLIILLVGCGPLGGIPIPSSAAPPAPPPQVVLPPLRSAKQPAGSCSPDQASSMGVFRSKDHGATWTYLGSACLQDPTLAPADPTALLVDGRIVIYFLDLKTLREDWTTPRIIYRTASTDGVNFDPPQPAYVQPRNMVDHFVLRMAEGSFRMYVPSDREGILSLKSSDGVRFTRDTALQGAAEHGGMPGALLLPDRRVRLFLDGGPNAPGIVSLISDDGLRFTPESGLRVSKPPDYVTINNPQPIRLADGTYLMLYQIQDKEHGGRPDWYAEMHLATSKDGLTWTADPKIIGYGGTSCVIEAADGTLYIYFGLWSPDDPMGPA